MSRAAFFLFLAAVLFAGCLPSSNQRKLKRELFASDSLSREIAASVPVDPAPSLAAASVPVDPPSASPPPAPSSSLLQAASRRATAASRASRRRAVRCGAVSTAVPLVGPDPHWPGGAVAS